MLYFAYGSNMSGARLRSRVPSARSLSVARLEAHRLAFHKAGSDGSAKCDAFFTDTAHHVVIGVVFEINPDEKHHLDKVEGLGFGYDLKSVSLLTGEGTRLEAFTYYATRIDPQRLPYQWYHEHVLRGALEHQLPDDYVDRIRQVSVQPDPDPVRHARELSIYG